MLKCNSQVCKYGYIERLPFNNLGDRDKICTLSVAANVPHSFHNNYVFASYIFTKP